MSPYNIYIYVYIYIYIHTYIHTYIHMYICDYNWLYPYDIHHWAYYDIWCFLTISCFFCHHYINGHSRILKWRYCTEAMFWSYIPLILASYMVATSNFGSWNGHSLYPSLSLVISPHELSRYQRTVPPCESFCEANGRGVAFHRSYDNRRKP